MKFTFIVKKMAPSDSLRAYAEKKVSKIDRLFRTESEANVTFSTERGRFTAEITIKNNGTFFRAHETTSDMYASVDSAVATIERQIRKNKTRLARRLRQALALRRGQIGGRLDTASSRLEERFARQLEGLERQLERHELRLRGLDPEGPLERGYAYAFTADGHFVRSIRDVQPGASLTVKIRGGEVDTRVTAVRATGESHDIP